MLTRSLFIVAVMLAPLVSAGVAYAQGTPTVPTIESVAVTSDPGVDGGYAIGDEIQVGLTFSEAVTVTGAPQLTLDVGGRNRTAEYSEGSTTTRLLFTYTVASGDEDTDGIAVVANSLALNGGAIRAGAINATLIHAALQANDHKVDGIAPTVTVGGETRTYVPPGRQFNVVFYFSEKVYGITDAEITVTNGEAHDVQATGGNDTWPRYIRWDVIIVPAAEGPVTVTLQAGAGADAYGNGNTAPDSALEVIAATPVTVEVARTTSGFAEGGKSEFTVTRSGDNGAIPVSLSLAQTGDFLSGAVQVYPPADPDNPDEPVTPQEFTFTETPFNLNVTFAAGETSKRIAVPTEDDSRDEDDGTVTLSVPARPDQYKYIPGPASSATADVRDNDVPFEILMTSDSYTPLSPLIEGEIAKYLLVHSRISSGLTAYLEFTEGLELLDLGGAGSRGYEHVSDGRISVELRGRYTTFSVPTLEDETIGPGGRITLVGQPGDGYVFSEDWINWTYRLSDDDSPPSVTLAAPVHVTEGDEVRYTITRTSDAGQSRAELTVNVQLEQTGDYITWPTAHQPDADGLVTIPVNFAARSLTATLTLETVDDQMSEDNGSVTAAILADDGGRYVTGAGSDHTTRLLDNDLPVISVAAVSAEVTEGTDAQFRFNRIGNTSGATRVGLWVGGLPKIMTDATEAIALTADNADLSQRLHIHGAWVDYILEFAAGEAEKTLSFTTEADNVNEGDGWFGVTIVQRAGNPFGIGTGYAQVHIHDDDVPTVTFSQVTLPTGAATLEGDTWVGELGEVQPLSWVVSCSGNYEYSPLRVNPSISGLPVQVENIRLANHPAFYGGGTGWELGRNRLGYVSGGSCDGQARTSADKYRVVGPDGGVETFKLVPKNRAPSIVAEYKEAYRQAKAAADAAGTLVTQPDIIHPLSVRLPHTVLINCSDEPRYCPQYRVGTPHKIRLTLVNRDPTILIKAENSEVEEGQPARFVVERLWIENLLTYIAPDSETVVALRASQNGQYITGALPTEITFGQNETSKIIELATVDDAAFGENGSVTIELLPDTTGADLNIAGKYETFEDWDGHTPEGARSDRATIAITNNDDKPGITIAPASAPEGDTGTADMTFTVTLAKAVTEAVTINYATSDGTAIAGQDYTAVSNGSVTIAAGNTTAEFTVSVTGDETDELDETFNVTISMPEPEPDLNGGGSGEPVAAITGGDTAAAVGTILDDDPAVVTVAPKVDTVEEGEAAVFVLTRAGLTNGALAMQVRLRAPGRLQMLDARFEPGDVTTEIAVATHNNNLVDYPSVRDYTIEVFGDGAPLGQDDRSFTPGAPATATVKVTDDDELINVTVYPVKAIISRGNPYWIFRRDGDISQPLSALFGYYLHKSDRSRTEITYGATASFEAGQDEVVLTYHDYDFVADIEYPPEDKGIFPITLTYTVFGDGGQYGLHRIYQGGNPNTATVTMEYNGYERRLVVGAEAPLWVSVGQTVNIPLMVTNAGSLDSGTQITITSTHYSQDRLVNGTNEPRMTCQFDGPIAAGESAGCEVSFLVLEKDLNWRNEAEIELDVVASDGRTTSNAFRIFMRVRNGVSVGFKETANLPVTEPGFGEANARANLTVTRVGQSGEEVQVAYTLEPWPTGFRSYSPVEGVDYADNSATPGVITFGQNETEKTITIDILGDQIDEAKEQFLVTLVPPEGVLVEEHKRTRIVVINDTNPPPGESYRPTASLQLVSSGPVPESEGPVEFAIVLDREWGIDARYEVDLTFDQLTATPGIALLGKKGDFEDPGVLVVRIPAGQTRFEFSIPLYDDDVREEDETFQLLLGSSIDKSFRTIGPSNTALATIADDDRVPPTEVVLSLSHNGSALESVPEGSTQQDITVTALFPRIRWPGDAANAPLRPADPRDMDTTVRVRFDPNSGATHAAGLDDFAPLEVEDDQGAFLEIESFDIAIPAGQTSGAATLRFRPVKDDVDEEDETVTLLGSELGAVDSADSLPVRSASFTIIDDDTRGITLSPAKLAAGTGISMEESGTSTYSLVLDSEPTDTVTVTVAGRQGDLISLTPETLTFTPSDWSTAQTISVVSLDDGTDTSFTNAVISHQVSGGDYGSVTVRDIWMFIKNTTQAYIYLDDAQASESDGYVEFTVTVRPILRTTPVLVRYATVDGTAIAVSDYTREVETGQTYKILNIPAGQSSATIRIPITDDQVYESADETFTLQLTNHNNKAMLDGGATSLTATGAIADDDPKPVVSVAGPAGEVSYVSENAKDPVTFTLTLVGQSAGDVTVDYATGEAGILDLFTARQGLAGATEDEDYAGTSGTVTFTSGQTTKTVNVQVTDDDVSEDTEFFGFRISAPQGADLRGQRSEDVADVGLVDDDARGVTIDPASISLHEPASGQTAVAGAYTVKLSSSPTDTVTVTIGGGDPAVSLSGDTLTNNQLTFTTTNWNMAQTITVTPVKDDNAVGETITLTHTLSGGGYAGIAADSVTVSLTDSDTRNLVLSEESLAVTEGDATGVGYTVKLATRPSDTVTVTISGHDGADLTLSGTTLTNNQLTFTTTNWGTAQTVTVKPGDDDNADNESETLAHTASGGDYVNITKDLPVSITDDDTPAIVLSETDLTVTEGVAAESSYTVKLATEPSGSVIVTISGHDGTDLSLSGTTLSSNMLTFTVDNWDVAQTVTVKAGQDDDAASDTATLTHTASGGDYASVSNTLPVTVTDDDTPGVTIEPTTLSVVAGRSNEYTVKLATEPTGDVTVTISGHAGTAVTPDKTTLTFTVGNWSMAQTVTVSATESAATAKVTLAHTVAGADYGSVTAEPVVVSVVGIAGQQPTLQVGVSELTQTLTVPEGGSNSYTLVLSSRPTGDVAVGVTLPPDTDLTLDKTTLTFTSNNWDTAQTVTVTAAEDDDGVTDAGVTLTHTVSGGGYGSTTVPDVEVSITENDTAAIVLSKTGLTVTEGAAAGSSYTVKLATQPSGSVSVTISGHDGTDLTLSGTTLTNNQLTFTTTSWGTAQTVTIKAGQDDDAVNDTATLTHTASGGDYAGIIADLPVTVTDDDTAAIVLSETGLTVTEGDAAGSSYTVKLATQPSDTVIVTISGHDGTDLTLSSDMLTFTVDNWDDVQTVTIKAGQDDDAVNDTATLTHTASGGDYASVSNTLPVTVTDDDSADIVLSETGLTVTEGDAAGSSYTVKLATQPTGEVTVTVSGHAGTDLTLDKTSLTFTSTTWDVAQTVTVTAAEDDDGVTDAGVTLTHTASGGDYASVSNTLPVSITDDDTPGVTLEPTTLSVVAGRSNEYTVALATKPTGDVTVTISGHAGTAVTPDNTTLTFTVGNSSMAQTVTVSATQNAATGKVTLAHTVAGADYGSVTAEPVVVSVVGVAGQQPTLQVGVSELTQTLTVPEGGANSYILVLSSRPTGDVAVGVTLPAGTDLTLDKTTLTFTSTTWDVAQTVTVTAAEDDDGVTDAGVTLTHTVSGGGYGSTTVPDVEVSITENDSAGIVLSKTGLTVTEGVAAGTSYTVALATQPSDTVSVSITGHSGTDLSLSGPTLSSNMLTFTVENWDTVQTVTVKAGQDNDGSADTATLTHTASGSDYVNITKDLPVSITDDDTAAIVLIETGLTVTEGDAAGSSYTVKLATQPSDTVIVTISGHDGTDLTLSGTTLTNNQLTFTVDDWATAQTVTVKAGDDDNADNESETLAHTAFGGDYVNVTKDLPVSITDDEVPVTVQFGATTYEVVEGETVTVAVTLSADPERTVVIPITHTPRSGAESPADYSGVPTSVTFNTGQMSKTITFTATQDAEDDDGESVLLAFGILPNGVSPGTRKETTVSITDDDDPAVTVSFEQAAYTVAEGGTVTVTVTLNADPERTVVIPITHTPQSGADSPADYSGVPSSVTFNTGQMSQTITFETIQDGVDDDGESVLLGFGAPLPTGVSEGAIAETTVSITDDDVPQVTVQFGATTYEVVEGETVTVAVTLSADPERTVVIPITHTPQSGADSPADYSGMPESLTFNAGDMSKTITFTATQDEVDDDGESVLLAFGILPNGVSPGTRKETTVSITDDDDPAVTVSFEQAAYTVAEGGTVTVTVTLNADPERTVVIPITHTPQSGADSPADYSGVPSSVTFNTGQMSQTITFETIQDGVDDDGESVLLGFGAPLPTGVSEGAIAETTVSITDDDVPQVTVQFGATTYEVVEGETVTVAVTLSADPERTVVIPITHTPQGSTTSADYSGVPANVTFSTGDMSQTITFTATQDDVDDGGKKVLLGFGTTLPGGVSLGTTTTTTVNITDDDGAGVTVSNNSLDITEGSSGTYTIVLDSQPTANVTVTINDPTDNTDATADPASLTFASTDWSTPQTVTVSAAQDADAENDTATVTHTVTSTDSIYSGASASSVTVTITDDEVPVTVSFGQANYTVAESDPVSVTVTLSADPERMVVIPLTHTPQGSTTSADYSGVPANVTFSTGDMSQTITFTATQDDVDDGGKKVLLAFGTTLPGGVSLGTTTTTTVNITDDDGAGVSVSESSLTIAEGSSGTYTIVLDSQPTADVTVTINDPSNTDVTAEPASLTFSSTDWNSPKTVTVNAAQDDDADDETATVTHAVTSTDSIYSGVSANSVAVSVTDDEVPVTVSFGQANYTVAEGDPVSVTVTLSADPERTVVIPITHTPQGSTTSADYSGVPANVTFNTGQMSQTIAFTAAQDDVDDDGESVLLGFGTPLPGGVSLGATNETTVSITDDDAAGVSVSESSLTITEGSSGTYTIVLDSQPTADVTVTINDPSDTDVTAEPASLTFSSTDWNSPKTVTVNAAQDDDADDETATVTHAVTSTDSIYSGVSANSVAVSVTDDEVPVTVSFGQANYTVAEGDPVSVTVTLSADPERMVVIPLTHTPQGNTTSTDYSGVPANVTFSTGDMSQTITFTATQDDVDDGGKSVLLAFGTLLPGGVSLGTTTTTTVNITDDDGAGVSISESSLTIAEGSSGTYTIVLDSQPTADVTVTINDPSNTDVTAEPASLTFSSTDWSTPQTVTVSAAQDADAENDTATVTHAVTSTDSIYSGVSANSVAVSVTDDEVPVTVSFGQANYTVAEGDPVSVTVTLSADPERMVVIPLTHTPQGSTTSADYSGVPANVTFSTGDMSQTITFTATQDDVDDGGKSVLLAFGTPLQGGVSPGTTVTTTVSITDDDVPAVTASFDRASYRVLEGDTVTVGVTLSGDPKRTVEIPLTATDYGGADSLADYSGVPTSVTFNEGDTSKTFEFMAMADDASDTGESVMIGFGTSLPSRVTEGTPNEARVTINQMSRQLGSGVTVSFGASSYTVAEGGMQSVTVSLSAGPSQTTVIPLTATNQGGATAADYSVVPMSVTFNALDTSKTITFSATEDMDDEVGESVLLAFGTLPGGVQAGTTAETTVSITDDCQDGVIWCTTATFDTKVEWEGRYDLHTGEVDNREFSYNGEDYQLWSLEMVQNGRNAGDDNHVVLPFGIPERTLFLIDFFNLNGTGHDRFEAPNDDWLDWTLHVSTVSDGETLTAALRFSEGRKLAGAWWRWSGGDIDDLRRAWKPGQLYKLRLVEDPRSQRTPQPLNPPLYLRVQGEVNTTQTRLRWLAPQTRYDRVPPVDSYKIQWKQSSGSWDTAADVSETTRGPNSNGSLSYTLDGLTPGVEYNIRVIATDSVGDSEPSNEITYTKPAAAQQSLSISPAEGEPRIDGIPEVGQTLSADTTAISDADGLENAVFQYQWLAEDADISGANGATYTVVSGDVDQAIRVRVTFTDDAGHEETLTSAPTVVTAGLQLQSATVDGAILTLTYSEVLDTGVTLGTTPFAVSVNGSSRSLIGVGVGESNVLLFLSSAVEAGDTVTVDYTTPDGPDFIRDSRGRKAASFSGKVVTNDTASPPLTASAHDAPASHNGQDAFTFELRFSEDPGPDFSYTSVRDHVFTVTGGTVTYVRRLEPGKNVRWEITVTPGSSADVTIDLNATTNCSAQGAICTEDGGKLSGGLLLFVPGPNAPATPNTPATDAPTITGTARVGETLTADTTGISDDDGLDNAAFAYQWLAAAAEINGATAATYTLADDDAGKAIKVRVSFTDDAGNDEQLTSAATSAVAAAPPPPNTPATGAPTITGTAQVGETLTADTTGISDDDGLDNATFAYQWLADNAEINGANASTYTLADADAGKAIKVKVSFTDDAGNDEQLTSAATSAVAAAPPPPNIPATGVPTITGAVQVGETLTANTAGISDDDGLVNAAFAYQWLADDAEINGATASSYTPVAADAGKAIKVRVSFTDDADNDEQITSAATSAVAAAVVKPPLTASAHDAPSSHNGQDAFTFELRFSEAPEPDFSYTTVRDHAFTVTGGSVTYVRRLEPGKNVRWEITVTPGSSADVAIVLNATTDCSAQGAICTGDGRMLSNLLELTIIGPGQ